MLISEKSNRLIDCPCHRGSSPTQEHEVPELLIGQCAVESRLVSEVVNARWAQDPGIIIVEPNLGRSRDAREISDEPDWDNDFSVLGGITDEVPREDEQLLPIWELVWEEGLKLWATWEEHHWSESC